MILIGRGLDLRKMIWKEEAKPEVDEEEAEGGEKNVEASSGRAPWSGERRRKRTCAVLRVRGKGSEAEGRPKRRRSGSEASAKGRTEAKQTGP